VLEALRLVLVYGAPFSFTVLAIVFSHEMGHYFTARRYRLDTTLPFFVPFPWPLFGTLGAAILIKSRFPHRKSLIDVGLAGPFAGFLVTIPALFVGIQTSRPGPSTPPGTFISFGEPLLFQWVSSWIWPSLPENHVLWVSPIGLAAWFGLFLTALNLFPVGQLDGGHATYALFRKGAHRLSRFMFYAFFPMAYFTPSWLVWAFFLYILGIRRPHPPTIVDDIPLPRSRIVMSLAALAVFVLCFTPEPIVFDWGELFAAIREARY
jgi:membrane-associated protease RseP (regulator of RpoE activity)